MNKEKINKNKDELKRELKVNELSKETKNNLFSRIFISILLVIIVIPTIFLGEYFIFALILFLVLISTHEIIKAPQSLEKRYHFLIYVISYLMILCLVFSPILNELIVSIKNKENFYIYNSYGEDNLPPLVLFFSIFLFIIPGLFSKTFSLKDAFYFIVMLLLVSYGFKSMLYIRYLPFLSYDYIPNSNFKFFESSFLFLYVIGTTCFTDVFAYLFGVLFGKHKMCPNISPKKTWEGFIGGILFGFIISFTFGIVCSYLNVPLLEGVLDFKHWYLILILSFLLPFVGTLGDLFFSKVKRELSIKDFGTILKSHGGVLDRFDSIIFSFIFSAIFISILI